MLLCNGTSLELQKNEHYFSKTNVFFDPKVYIYTFPFLNCANTVSTKVYKQLIPFIILKLYQKYRIKLKKTNKKCFQLSHAMFDRRRLFISSQDVEHPIIKVASDSNLAGRSSFEL